MEEGWYQRIIAFLKKIQSDKAGQIEGTFAVVTSLYFSLRWKEAPIENASTCFGFGIREGGCNGIKV